jgi:alkylation response protein AidB-like acyl-CoA dehydrogenase
VDLTLSPQEQSFRDELRAWLEENHPGEEPPGDDAAFAFRRDWQRKMHAAGWTGISWPKEYGGRGATLMEQAIFNEELARAQAPSTANVLASLKTKAVRSNGEWVVTGQKVWTTFAHEAKWCMLVARTDFDAPKHKGLTYFIMDMEQEGVQVRPLKQVTGESEFNEIFMEEARIPDENRVGAEGEGWSVAITTLMNERSGLGAGAAISVKVALGQLMELVRERGLADDPVVRQKIGQLYIEAEALRLTAYRGLTHIMKTGAPGPEGSLPKWQWSDLNQKLTETAMDVLGPDALTWDDDWTYRFLRARANSIEGGTTEILKNIVAERVLGLPKLR